MWKRELHAKDSNSSLVEMSQSSQLHQGRKVDQFALAAPAVQVTEHDDQHCGNAIPRDDSPRISGLNVADDPMPCKQDRQHDQGGNYQTSLAR